MSKMKELFIQMQNEDWEHLSRQERGFIQAEREYMERQMMQQIWEEEQLKAKIIKEDDTTEEIRENTESGTGPEHGDIATISIRGSEDRQPRWELPKTTQLALDFGKKTPDSSD